MSSGEKKKPPLVLTLSIVNACDTFSDVYADVRTTGAEIYTKCLETEEIQT